METKYLAFYTTKPFWAGEPLVLDKINTPEKFTESMSEEVFIYEHKQFSLKVCKDGMIMIQIKKLERQISKLPEDADITIIINLYSKYLEYANCFYLLLDSCGAEVDNTWYFDISEITNKDAFFTRYENGKLKGYNITTESLSYLFQMLRHPRMIQLSSPIFHMLLSTRHPLSKAVFDLATKNFSYVVNDDLLVEMLSGIAKSISEFKVGNFSTGIVLAWFVIESILNSRWKSFLDEKNIKHKNGSRINSKRRERFMGRDYPVSVKLNLLELSDKLSFSIFKDIDEVRAYRNNIVHRDSKYKCEPEHCQLAIQTALNLALEGQSFKTKTNLSYSVSGI